MSERERERALVMRMLMPCNCKRISRMRYALLSERDGDGGSDSRIVNALLAHRLHGSPSSDLRVGISVASRRVAGSLQNGSASRFTSLVASSRIPSLFLSYSIPSPPPSFHSIPFLLLHLHNPL